MPATTPDPAARDLEWLRVGLKNRMVLGHTSDIDAFLAEYDAAVLADATPLPARPFWPRPEDHPMTNTTPQPAAPADPIRYVVQQLTERAAKTGDMDLGGLAIALSAIANDVDARTGRLATDLARAQAERHQYYTALQGTARRAATEAALPKPSRFTATPAQIDAFLRTHFCEDRIQLYQWAIGNAAAHEAAEEIRAETVRLHDHQVLEPDKFRPCRDAADQIDPATGGGHYPSELIDLRPTTKES